MNKWECEARGCTNTAVGVGGGVGLRAIGWYFHPGTSMRGPVLFCPWHRPDGMPCKEPPKDADESVADWYDASHCSVCTAQDEARAWQEWIMQRQTGGTVG